MPHFVAIVPAAGSSTRFGRNKLLEALDGVSVLHRTLLALANHASCSAIYLATSDDAVVAHAHELDAAHKPIHLCRGGATRADSVLSALQEVPVAEQWVAVHDAARPLVSAALIDRTFAAAVAHAAAAAPALSVHLTIKQAPAPLPAKVQRTIPRDTLWSMQTPQFAPRADLLDAFARCPIPLETVTDDVQLMELIGKDVWLVPGEESNLKITTPLDLAVAEALRTHRT